MTDDIRRHAPDERAANGLDPATHATSLPLESPIRTTSAPPSPHLKDCVIQLSLPVNLPNTKESVREFPSPHQTTLGKTVIQLSSSVNKTLQRPQHTQHATTDLIRQPPKTYIHKRQRPSLTHFTVTNRETTRDNTSPGKQKLTDNPKERPAQKTQKKSHHTSPTTTPPETCIPTNNTPHTNMSNQDPQRLSLHPATRS